MPTALTGQIILNKFELYVGDQSELSSADELDLLNKKYDEVMSDRPWEFIKKSTNLTTNGGFTTVAGVTSSDVPTATIPIPSDFRYFIEDNQMTDNSDHHQNNAGAKVIYVGSQRVPYQIVNWSDRRRVQNRSGYCFLDRPSSCIRFTTVPPDTSYYEFDYIQTWVALTTSTSPIFPAEFHPILFHLMCVDEVIIELFDRTHSYAVENQNAADDFKARMAYWNSMQTNN